MACSTLSAQGTTTGAISGTVTSDQGPAEGVQIQIVNTATGYRAAATTRSNGRYFVQGLEVGGPYTVSARKIGLAQETRQDVMVNLSQNTRVDFELARSPSSPE